MVKYILFMWLASAPNTLTPVDYYWSSDACWAAKSMEISANIRAGRGAGVTYICKRED